MSDILNDSSNKKKGLGRGLGSLLGGPSGSAGMQSSLQANASSTPTTLADLNKKNDMSNGAGAVSAGPVVNTPMATQAIQQSAPPPAAAPVNPESKIWQVAVDKLQPGQFQPRRVFDKEALQELSVSIKENGILQPIVARRIESGKLEIVAGERRWRAAQLAGLHEVPVILKSFDDKQALELAIIENIQREDLNPIEEAEGYARLISEFKLSQQQVADRVGRDRATVANAVRVLSLPNEVKELISNNELSVGHAKVLLALNDPQKQIQLAKKVINEKIAVRKLEKMVQAENQPGKLDQAAPTFDSGIKTRLIAGLEDELQKLFGTKVSIDYTNSKGKISVHFFSDDELSEIVDKMRAGCQK